MLDGGCSLAHYEIDVDGVNDCLCVRYSGVVGLDDLTRVMARTMGDSRLRRLRRRIHDLRGTEISVDKADFDTLVQATVDARKIVEEEGLGQQVAVVVDSDLGFGLARMLSAITDDPDERAPKILAFRALEEATAWMGIDG